MITFGSVCSGIEAASVAWHPLGWRAAWLAEIEPFPSAVLAHHYPEVPNLGDMTTLPDRIRSGEVEAPDVFCGGTPCQAFSVAGLRRSLDDARGNLSLTFCEIADAIDSVRLAGGKPASIVFWENVPGVLSTADNAFGCFLAGLAGESEPLVPPGRKWEDAGCVLGPARAVAWRTLDAQYFGLAQRRRRVFVVASARDGFDPAAVLLEWEGLRRDTPPSREAGQRVANALTDRADRGGTNSEGQRLIAQAFGGGQNCAQTDVSTSLSAHPGGSRLDFQTETFVTHSLRGEGFDASEDGTGRGTPLVPVAWTGDGLTADPISASEGRTYTHEGANFRLHNCVQQPVAFQPRIARNGRGNMGDVVNALQAQSGQTGKGDAAPCVATAMQVRRLTPVECSRLQGFPGDYLELIYADADEAHAAQILHELWKQVGASAFEKQEWGTGISAALLTPEILLAGVYGGWIPWQMAAECAAASRSIQSQNACSEEFVRALRSAGASGCSPYQRQSFGQLAHELGSDMSILPLERAQARKALRSNKLWPQAQEKWPLRYAFAAPEKRDRLDRLNPDGPRYKALGNSWAVPVVRWIGRRIHDAVQGTNPD